MFINTTNQYITQTDVWQGHVFLFIFRLVVNQFQAWFSIMIVWVMYVLIKKGAVVCMEINFLHHQKKIKSFLIPPKSLPLMSSPESKEQKNLLRNFFQSVCKSPKVIFLQDLNLTLFIFTFLILSTISSLQSMRVNQRYLNCTVLGF